MVRPKKIGKSLLARILERQVRELRYRQRFTVVAVAGSVGKTTTKLAIAQVLGQKYRVRFQEGNYNDRVTVPLVFFGQTQPSIWNVLGWLKIIGSNLAVLEHPYPYDVVVVELGTDGPEQMRDFAYIQPDITVLTAVTPEHMVNFQTIDAVAADELAVFDYSRQVVVNSELTPAEYLKRKTYNTYALHSGADFWAKSTKLHLGGQELQIHTSSGIFTVFTRLVGLQGAQSALAAVSVASLLGMQTTEIQKALEFLQPFAGRMQVLPGIKGSQIIDDTYNSSPVAAQAALDVLYNSRAKQRIAVLGSMNELGAYAKEAHELVGAYCDPNKLDLVLTLGSDAERWLAPAARDRGCVVKSFASQHACAAYIRKHVKQNGLVLCKGSQNGVFAEEVVKQLLANPRDAKKLVRQSPAWMRRKKLG